MMHHAILPVKRQWSTGRNILAACLTAAATACSSLLDVRNPNNVNATDLDKPAAAPSIANGALSTLARAWGFILLPYGTASDELTWIGSRDGWRDLDIGFMTNPTNEFVDAAFPYVGEARWTTDLAIKKIGGFAAAGTLRDSNDLSRSYLYGALAYTMVGDMFNKFPIASNRDSAAAPLDETQIVQVYDTAIAYATRGLTVAVAKNNKSHQLALTAARARARFAKLVWAKLHPVGAGVPHGGPLVNDATVNADASAAIALLTALKTPDWKFRYAYSATTVDNTFGAWVNQRQEMRFGSVFARPSPKDTIRDPITGAVDPVTRTTLVDLVATAETNLYAPLTALSARELYLILAESALAAGDTLGPTSGFAVNINLVRSLGGVPNYDPTNPAHPRPVAMLKYERQVNLFYQGRRIHDLYRFADQADLWQVTPPQETVAAPGTFFPITQIELLANPFCVANPRSC